MCVVSHIFDGKDTSKYQCEDIATNRIDNIGDECLFYLNTDNFEDMGAIYAMYITINRDKIKNGDLSEFYFSYSFD